jgi:hypothetical protein
MSKMRVVQLTHRNGPLNRRPHWAALDRHRTSRLPPSFSPLQIQR